MKPKRSHKLDRLAKLYDAEILPIWSARFGRMLLREVALPPRAMVLDVGTGTGFPALELLRRMDDAGRIISIDPSSAMLDVAREKAGPLGGKRIFFRTESAEPRLSFADEVFDLVVSNLALSDFERPEDTVREFARVAKPGARVVATFPAAGTFVEFVDLFREVLLARGDAEALARLDAWEASRPAPATARAWFERAGLVDVAVEHETYTIVFKSSREFFFSPVIEFGPLIEWKEIAGRGEEMQDVFWRVKEAIDTYFAGRPFAVTVRAACASGRRPLEDEIAKPAPTAPAVDDETTGVHILLPEDAAGPDPDLDGDDPPAPVESTQTLSLDDEDVEELEPSAAGLEPFDPPDPDDLEFAVTGEVQLLDRVIGGPDFSQPIPRR